MMMTMSVNGSGMSLCADFNFSGTSVSCRTGLEFTGLEFLRERKSGAAREKNQAYNDTRPPDIRLPVCGGTAKPA
jgi:hypothetical protein